MTTYKNLAVHIGSEGNYLILFIAHRFLKEHNTLIWLKDTYPPVNIFIGSFLED